MQIGALHLTESLGLASEGDSCSLTAQQQTALRRACGLAVEVGQDEAGQDEVGPHAAGRHEVERHEVEEKEGGFGEGGGGGG